MSYLRPVTTSFFLILAIAVYSWPARAEENAREERIRAAVQSALEPIQRGATGSADQRECFTCHHQAIPVFALRTAMDHGFAVARQVFDRQVQHTVAHLRRGLEGYRKAEGQGGAVLTAGYALWTLDEATYPADELTQAVAHYLQVEQSELPFWRHQGQRPPSSGSDFTATYVALRALHHYGSPSEQTAIEQRRKQVASWLTETQPTETEDHVFRLLSTEYLETPDAVRADAIRQLVALQQPDGGWTQKPLMTSDAYATATVLYALQRSRDESVQDSISKGIEWLLSHQQGDGTWHVVSRAEPFQTYFETGFPHGKDQFLSMAATAWSTVVLCHALPDQLGVPDATRDERDQMENKTDDKKIDVDNANKSLTCITASGPLDPAMVRCDEVIREFLAKHQIRQSAFAITDQGRIVFARGYDLSEPSETERPTDQHSLFRIASVSKPITAVAILKLVEQGKLDLDDHVFSVLNLEHEVAAIGESFDARWRQVTIRHLLEHRGGWDRDVSFDPMFQSVRFARELGIHAPAEAGDVIRAMLRRPLDFDPGQRFAYSNFGYSLLGRVIEAVSGMRYEDYVRQRVLEPIGIESMRIGKTRASERAEGEVRYVASGTGPSVFDSPTSPNDQSRELTRSGSDLNAGDSNTEAKRAETEGEQVPQAYGAWYLEAMDSHGGWLASAVDLARFASALEDSSQSGLLKPETFALMNARPAGLAGFDDADKPKDVFYSLGWQNRAVGDNQVNRWHTGSLPGTTAILIRRHDGRNLIALLNTRESPASKELGLYLDRLLHKAANKVETWPTHAVIE